MDWCNTPGLYQSPGFSPANWLLPPTPDDGNEEWREICVLPQSPIDHAHPAPTQNQLTSTQAYQQTTLPMPWLANGELKQLDPKLYPGLQCMASEQMKPPTRTLGKRPVSETLDSVVQPASKSLRPAPNYEQNDPDEVVYGEPPHMSLGIVFGRHRCSCGKDYGRAFRLRQHIEVLNGVARYPCLVCGMMFTRQDSLNRHEDSTHKGKKIACPGCNKDFRPDYLPKHLASSKNDTCRVIAHAIYIQANNDMDIDTRLPAENYWLPDLVDTLKQRSSHHNHDQGRSAGSQEAPTPEALAKILLHERPSQNRPLQRSTREPCDLCGMPLGPGEKELIDHISKHSLDFSAKPFRCDECDINFAYQSDLDMHLDAATRKGQCGFKFLHKKYKPCTGHHPQPYVVSFDNDHKRMQEILWAWENCQLRAHRATIARLLAERIQYTQAARHSIANDELTCIAILTRLSIGSIHSFHSVPAWMEYPNKLEIDDLDAEFNSLSLPSGEVEDIKEEAPVIRGRARPESTVLGRGDFDFTMRWENGQLRPVLRKANHTQASSARIEGESNAPGQGNTYVDQVKAMRAPGGFKTRATGVRYRAMAATRYYLTSSRGIEETSELQYVQTAS